MTNRRAGNGQRWWVIFCIVATLCSCTNEPPGSNGDTHDNSPESRARAVLASSVPDGWHIEQAAAGQLNDDTVPDLAAILVESDGNSNDERKRRLQVAVGTPNGEYRLLEPVTKLLPCHACLGLLGMADGEDQIMVDIDGKRVVLGWLRGSRDSVEASIELGLDPQQTRLVLLKDDVIRTDRALGHESRVVRDFVAGQKTVDGNVTPMPSDPPAAKSLSFEDY